MNTNTRFYFMLLNIDAYIAEAEKAGASGHGGLETLPSALIDRCSRTFEWLPGLPFLPQVGQVITFGVPQDAYDEMIVFGSSQVNATVFDLSSNTTHAACVSKMTGDTFRAVCANIPKWSGGRIREMSFADVTLTHSPTLTCLANAIQHTFVPTAFAIPVAILPPEPPKAGPDSAS